MFDQDDRFREDPLAVGRGIVYGVLIGAVLWAVILGAVWYFFF